MLVERIVMQARDARPRRSPAVARWSTPPLPPFAGNHPAGPTRRRWWFRAVPGLSPEDVVAVHESLRRHAAESEVERLERGYAMAAGRPWRPVLVEADGLVIDDISRLRTWPGGGPSLLRMRTFGRAAIYVAGPSGHLLSVDDGRRLARRTCAEVGAIVRRRRGRTAGFLGSEWGIPGFVLAFPIAASALETASGRSGLALSGLGAASAVLVLWLRWCHERPGTPTLAVVRGGASSRTATARAALVAVTVAVALFLAVAGVSWLGSLR